MAECPGCGTALVERLYEGVQIDQCPSCGGTWLDDKEIAPIVQTQQETFSEEAQIATVRSRGEDVGSGKPVACPKCRQPMPRLQYAVNSGVFLNRCPEGHGLWLDPGELERVQIVMEEFDERYASVKPQESLPILDAMHCPRCDVELREIPYESEHVDLCPRCKGVWCETDELGKIVESHQQAFTEGDHPEIRPDESTAVRSGDVDLVASLACVACRRTMERTNFGYTSGIIIDRCPEGHGVWLDHGELERIQVFSERWATQDDRIATQYAGALAEARAHAEREREAAYAGIQVSRFGVVNRLVRSLARRGLWPTSEP